mmetsp:Transcript_14085/g.34428  ORF Transcript_14085/g.34428 Transcript_14085/m.34428 type:complete len:202 (+) Transcript_14085:238-843(+)
MLQPGPRPGAGLGVRGRQGGGGGTGGHGDEQDGRFWFPDTGEQEPACKEQDRRDPGLGGDDPRQAGPDLAAEGADGAAAQGGERAPTRDPARDREEERREEGGGIQQHVWEAQGGEGRVCPGPVRVFGQQVAGSGAEAESAAHGVDGVCLQQDPGPAAGAPREHGRDGDPVEAARAVPELHRRKCAQGWRALPRYRHRERV